MKVVPLMIALVLTLTGCDTAEAETLVPGVTPDSPDINFGQIPGGLPAGFYDEAEENVSVAVERYIAMSDEITAAGASDISSMEALVSPEWWETERAGFSHFVENSLRTVGTSQVSRFLVQSARITPEDTVEVGAIACIDTTGVFHLPVDAPDPPEVLWEWHPHYEDFEGDPAVWAEIEQFLEQPGLSWGAVEPVVFWFLGPAMDSLVLTSSEPWWGVYPCV
ncbi:MAG: hypothetical protein ACO35C_00705 [Pontimonas sp.]